MSRQITINKEQIFTEISKLIAEGKTVTLLTKGYSMNPFIMHLRDTIIIGPWKDEEIRKGTVVLAKDIKGQYIVHRVISREKDIVTLMGDGNIGLKETAHVEDIIGRLYQIKRKGRTYQTEGLTWRLYSWLWMALTPLRRWPLGLWRRLYPQQPLR